MMDITFQLSEADAIEAAPRPTLLSRFGVALGILVITGFVLIFLKEVLAGEALILFAFLFPFLLKRRLRAVVKKQFRAAPFLHGEIRARIDGAGIEMTYPTGSSKTTWEGFHGCRETRHLLVLLLSPAFFRAFPKRAFTPDQLIEFRRLLQQHKLTPSA